MRVHAIQLGYDDLEPIDKRVQRAAALVRAQVGADLVVLPELWAPTGFDYHRWNDAAEPLDGPTFSAIADATRDLGAIVHAGSIIERAGDGSLYNTSVLLDRDGARIARYRKIHRFGFGSGEPKLLEPGQEIVTTPVFGDDPDSPVTIGLATCYDLRFPEQFRLLLDAGAELVIVPAAWPQPRVGAWSLLGRARALENQTFLVQVNTAGTHAGTVMGGRSQIVDPMGEVLAEAGPDEQVLTADLDLSSLAEIRERFPVLADRRL